MSNIKLALSKISTTVKSVAISFITNFVVGALSPTILTTLVSAFFPKGNMGVKLLTGVVLGVVLNISLFVLLPVESLIITTSLAVIGTAWNFFKKFF